MKLEKFDALCEGILADMKKTAISDLKYIGSGLAQGLKDLKPGLTSAAEDLKDTVLPKNKKPVAPTPAKPIEEPKK